MSNKKNVYKTKQVPSSLLEKLGSLFNESTSHSEMVEVVGQLDEFMIENGFIKGSNIETGFAIGRIKGDSFDNLTGDIYSFEQGIEGYFNMQRVSPSNDLVLCAVQISESVTIN